MNTGGRFTIFMIIFTCLLLSTSVLTPVQSEKIQSKEALDIGDSPEHNGYSISNSYHPMMYTLGPDYLPEALINRNLLVIPIPIEFGPFGLNRAEMIIPSHWKKGNQVGVFFDPILKMTWLYDWHYHTYYSPESGWVLITEYSPYNVPIAQYYHDPNTQSILDSRTGYPQTQVISSGYEHEMEEPTILPSPLDSGVGKNLYEKMGSDSIDTSKSLLSPTEESQSCFTIFSTCPTGYCEDCNLNGICDENEQTNNTEGMSEETQMKLRPTPSIQIPSSSSSENSFESQAISESASNQLISSISSSGLDEESQAIVQKNTSFTPKPNHTQSTLSDSQLSPPIQISLVPPLPVISGESNDTLGESINENLQETGYYEVSDEPQASIYYYKIMKRKGPFPVISCNVKMNCQYCVDEDNDFNCSLTECYVISSDLDSSLYCLDCNRDGICDSDKIIIQNCNPDEECSEFDYCDDTNLNLICDYEEEKENSEEINSIYEDWWDIDWK